MFFTLTLACATVWGRTSPAGDQTGPEQSSEVAPFRPNVAEISFLNSLEHRTFNFFWKTTHRRNGLTPDRYPTKSFSSIAAVGFALTAYPIGVERGYITREQAIRRVRTTLQFFRNAKMGPNRTGVTGYQGFYYHFLDQETGTRFDHVELSSIDYAIQNPLHYRDYSDSIWGLTACDGPGDATIGIDGVQRRFQGYAARGVSFDWVNDDGTISPTAAGGSLPFAPAICLPSLTAMIAKYGRLVWRKYGFVDAFNPTFPANGGRGWFDHDYLGIDQGPILLMVENYRTGLVWKFMRRNQYIVSGLRRAGFTGGWLESKSKSHLSPVAR